MNLENLRNLNSNINHEHQCIYELKTRGQKTQDGDIVHVSVTSFSSFITFRRDYCGEVQHVDSETNFLYVTLSQMIFLKTARIITFLDCCYNSSDIYNFNYEKLL